MVFYSNVKKGIEKSKQEKASPLQWLNMLKNSHSLKVEEDFCLGLTDWLQSNKKLCLTKKELLTFVTNNEISLQEIILDTKNNFLDDYSTCGLKHKKELIFSVDHIESWDDDFVYHDITGGKTIAWARFGETIDNGNNVLVIDEIQSRRHQVRRMNPDANIPPAPFEKSWYKLIMKRIIRYAAENNYDRIAWTIGNTQSKRCGASLKYDELLYTPDDGVKTFPGKIILVLSGKNTPLFFSVENKNKLVRLIGKKITEKIIAGEYRMSNLTTEHDGVIEFYDYILPQFINKYCKKWNTSTRSIEILQNKMHSIDITRTMIESVMQGQAMFRTVNRNYLSIPISTIEIRKKICELQKKFPADVLLIDSRQNIQLDIAKQMDTQKNYSGVFDSKDNKVYMLLDELNSIEETEKTFKHEVLGHHGLRTIYKERLHKFFDKVLPLIPKEDKAHYLKIYSNRYTAIEEYIATKAENYKNPTIWNKTKSIFKNRLRNCGISLHFSENDIRCVLSKREYILKKTKTLASSILKCESN